MDKCWANPQGNCSDKISREHLISKGIFENRELRVKGFSWCKNEFKNIGVEAITRKCLCDKHNNSLTKVDSEGIKFFNILDNIATLTTQSNKDYSKQIIETSSGNLIERWFLKTLLNLTYNSEYQIGQFGEIKGKPHLYLVDVVFGKISFSQYMGLYALVSEGDYRKSEGEIAFFPLIQNNETIGGGVFSFRGIDFFLSLTPSIPPHKLGYLDIKGVPERILNSVLLYHCPKMEWSNNKQYHRVNLTW